ncbi:MAG: hypothetical protein LBC79_02355, partial [Deltaproteobacteria bacterium]|nr:hypothetical protein [Deltaproteobacteria bacterium]
MSAAAKYRIVVPYRRARTITVDDAPLITQMLDGFSALLGFTVSLELLFVACVLAAGAGFLVTSRRKRRLGRLHAQQKARIARELLLTAIDQRSTMELEFNSEAMHGRKLSGP